MQACQHIGRCGRADPRQGQTAADRSDTVAEQKPAGTCRSTSSEVTSSEAKLCILFCTPTCNTKDTLPNVYGWIIQPQTLGRGMEYRQSNDESSPSKQRRHGRESVGRASLASSALHKKMAKTKVTKALKSPTVSKVQKVTKGPNVSRGLKVTTFKASPRPEASRFGCRTWRAICGIS